MEVEPERALFGSPNGWRYRRNTRSGPPGSRGALRQLVNDDPLSGRDPGSDSGCSGICPPNRTDNHALVSVSAEYFATLGVPLLLDEVTARDGGSAPEYNPQ